MPDKIIILSAPSGAGKTTLVKHLLSIADLRLEFSISACSRSMRHGEVDGKDYYFLSVEEFKNRIKNNDFVEWEEVYENQFYGTLKSELNRIWSNGNNVIFDVDVAGGINLKKIFSEQALSIFIMPPSLEVLKQRLQNRSSDSEEQIAKRILKAEYELTFAPKFDKVVINDKLNEVQKELELVTFEFLGLKK